MATAKQTLEVKRRMLFVTAGIVLGLAFVGYIMYDFWVIQQKTQAVLGAPGIIRQADTDNPEKANEGSEATAVTRDVLAEHTAAPHAPRALYIDKLNIATRIQPMFLNNDKSIQAPKNINDAGWYVGSAYPGESGAMFIDGHASGVSRLGLFAYLDTLTTGDTLTVEKGDGTKLQYRVVHTAIVPLESVDMGAILAPYPGVDKGLNLMTCTGTWVKDSATLDHRVVVYTEQV